MNRVSSGKWAFPRPAAQAADVEIYGHACRFPESEGSSQFWDNLLNKIDCVTKDERRWPPGLHDIPARFGKLVDIESFDASFFSVHGRQAQRMDPQLRKLLEVGYEAWTDSGINHAALRGSARVGVYVGCCGSEIHSQWLSNVNEITGYEQTGCTLSMFANRLSFYFDFKGPSKAVDTACSSSFVALNDAVVDLQRGRIDYAMVGGASALLRPATTVAFNELHMVSPDGACKSFDASANGYARAEGVAVVVLRRGDVVGTPWLHRRGPYARILGIGTNNDGFTEKGITFPSGPAQSELGIMVCANSKIKRSDITYVEAHGTGTVVGDAQELSAIDAMYGTGAGRTSEEPLLVGSVKSNMGHCEGCSGLAALIKTCLVYEMGLIPGNLHYSTPNPNSDSLTGGILQVVTEATPWKGGLIAISNFGFGGSNVHCIVAPGGTPSWASQPLAIMPAADSACEVDDQGGQQAMRFIPEMPRELIIPVCARTLEGAEHLLNRIKAYAQAAKELSVPLKRVANEQAGELGKLSVRGTICNGTAKWSMAKASKPLPVWFVFSGNGSQWSGMGAELLKASPVFRAAIDACATALEPLGIDLRAHFMAADSWQSPMLATVGLAALQVGLVDVLREEFGVIPAGCLGHSAGEIACGYADGCLSREQTVLVAYHRGRMAPDNGVTGGAMAAVGLSAAEAAARIAREDCPGVVVACDNSPSGVTLSGPAEEVSGLLEKLLAEGVFTKAVDTQGIAYHSPLLQPLTEELRADLEKVIAMPKARTKTWLTTCYPQGTEEIDASLCGAAYHVQGFANSVLFTTAAAAIPQDVLLLEVGPHALLRGPLRSNRPALTYCATMKKGSNAAETMHECAAELWRNGAAMKWAVPRGLTWSCTELPRDVRDALVSWNHTTTHKLPDFKSAPGSAMFEKVFDTSGKHDFLTDHIIDGRVLMPATSYVCTAWEAAAAAAGKQTADFPVEFSNVQIHQAVVVTQGEKITLAVQIAPDRHFYVLHAGDIICEGYVKAGKAAPALPAGAEDNKAAIPEEEQWGHDDLETVQGQQFYNAVSRMGIKYGPHFRMVQRISTHADTAAQLRWDDCFIRLLDGMLQVIGFANSDFGEDTALRIPTRIRSITIAHPEGSPAAALPCTAQRALGAVHTPLATVIGLELSSAPRSAEPPNTRLTVKQLTFVPYGDSVDGTAERELYANHLAGYLKQGLLPVLQNWEGPMPDHLQQVYRLLGSVEDRAPEASELENFFGKPRHHLARIIRDLLHPDTVRDNLKDPMTFIVQHPDHERLYTDDPVSSHNISPESLDTVLDIVLQNVHSGLCVIEAGAGTGGLTRDAFPFLNEDNHSELLQYTCTDISNFWAPKLLDTIAAPNAQFKVWDLNGPASQEVGRNYDLLLASNALHTSANIADTLSHAAEVLKPGGFICIYESVCMLPALVWGLSTQCWNFTDERDFSLWIRIERWEKLLAAAGFDKVMIRRDREPRAALMLYRKRADRQLAEPLYIAAPPGEATADEMDTWLEDYRTKIGEVSGMAKHLDGAPEETEGKEESPAEEGKQPRRLWLHGDVNSSPGAFGLFRTIAHEPLGEHLRLVMDNTLPAALAPATGQPMPFEKLQGMLALVEAADLAQNVFQDGKWGTLRMEHVELKEACTRPAEELGNGAHMDLGVNGDLSSLYWRQNGPWDPDTTPCTVSFAAFNFKDVMLAYGKLDRSIMAQGYFQACLGFEFSGATKADGRPVMGIAKRALATQVSVLDNLVWDVPQSWSLQDAATVPVAYLTAYYALLMRGGMRAGHKVLVHSGTGAVGMAAIRICGNRGCEVFTTCGSQRKRDILLKTFPFLDDNHIGDSRSTSFEALILQQTKGRGVDLALNSLADDKLLATVRCIAPHGHLLEIGKYDILKGTGLPMTKMHKNVSFQGVDLDTLFLGQVTGMAAMAQLHAMLGEGITSGEVQPLPWTVFARSRAEDAFRYLASGVHMGKVLLQVADAESGCQTLSPGLPDPGTAVVPVPALKPGGAETGPLQAKTVFTARPDASYLLVGGLGGLGLALAAWLAQNGAKHLVLSSKRGLRSGHQQDIISKMIAHGVSVTVSKLDVVEPEQAIELIALAESRAPLAGIFQLAMVLDDRLIAKQTGEAWNKCVKPKVAGTWNVDAASRGLPALEHFICFSSIVGTQGNVGQSSYSFANNAASQVCRARRTAGLPGISLGWGPIGNVGFVADSEIAFTSRTFQLSAQQPVDEVLSLIGDVLSADQGKLPCIFSCCRVNNQSGRDGDEDAGGLVAAILGMLGMEEGEVKDADTLESLGVDSMQAAEIRSRLQRALGRPIPLEEVGALTFGKLKAIESEAAATPAQAEGQGSGKTSAQKDSADIHTPEAGTEQQEPVPEVNPEPPLVTTPRPVLATTQVKEAPLKAQEQALKAPSTPVSARHTHLNGHDGAQPQEAQPPVHVTPPTPQRAEELHEGLQMTPPQRAASAAPAAPATLLPSPCKAAAVQAQPLALPATAVAPEKEPAGVIHIDEHVPEKTTIQTVKRPLSPPQKADSASSFDWLAQSGIPNGRRAPTPSPSVSERSFGMPSIFQAASPVAAWSAMAVLALANVSLLLVHFSVHVPWRTVFVLLCLTALALAYHTLGGVFLLGHTLRSWSQSSAAALLDRHMAPIVAVTRSGMAEMLDIFLENVLGRCMYLVDFHVFQIPDRMIHSTDDINAAVAANSKKLQLSKGAQEFTNRVMSTSAISSTSGLPDGLWELFQGKRGDATNPTLADAQAETELIIFDVVDNLLKKTNTDPLEIDIVMVSCSCYAPTPSMAAAIVNKFRMRKDVLTYHLAGMGCSSSLICIDMAKRLLKAMPNTTCLIVNHENITFNYYRGRDRAFLLPTALFRLGGAAALMTNRASDAARAKYELQHTVRHHMACEDPAYLCMGYGADGDRLPGVFLRKNVIETAGRSLTENLARLAPLLIPASVKIKARAAAWLSPGAEAPQQPQRIGQAFQHLLLHTGGRGVLDAMQQHLRLSDAQMGPARETLLRFGNTSAASTWYILANVEHRRGVRKGDRLLQLGFGGGFKCNTAVWCALRDVNQPHSAWEGSVLEDA